MNIRYGTTSICSNKDCGEEIYYGGARDHGDPWVHRNWTAHAHAPEETGRPIRRLPDGSTLRKLPPYDHSAQPTMADYEYVVKVEAVMTSRPDETRSMVAQALHDSERFKKITVTSART